MIRRLSEMTSAEAGCSASGTEDIIVFPVGALEQHGPGLPLGTDTIRAEAVAERVAEQAADHVVLGPTLPFGVSPHHVGFPGTVDLTPEIFVSVVRRVVLEWHRQGHRRVLVLTGHGGNNASLSTLAQELLVTAPRLQFAWSPLTSLAADIVREAGVSAVHGHAGEAETAQMLAVAPRLVRTDQLQPGTVDPSQFDPLSALARRVTHPAMARAWDDLTANGVLGDPRNASPELGEALIDTITRRIVDYIGEWARIPLAD